jgi:hypothetical protein
MDSFAGLIIVGSIESIRQSSERVKEEPMAARPRIRRDFVSI